ncbi:hypothetical protein L6R29_09565 [Myxococcota bacterium]|nr:hypothetical protein [Myxococcota bacterium]
MAKKDNWDPEGWRNEAEPDEREDGQDPRASEGWEAYVPEFVKRSLFGTRETNPPRDAGQQEGGNRESGSREDSGRGWISREVARELAKIPREVAREMARAMLAQADRLKTETSKAIAHELRGFLGQLDLWKELRKAMDGTTLEIEMKVRFRSQGEGQRLEPDIERLRVDRKEPTSGTSQTDQAEAPISSQEAKEQTPNISGNLGKKAASFEATTESALIDPKRSAIESSVKASEGAALSFDEKAQKTLLAVAKESKEL